MNDISTWGTKDWLEASTFALAIVGTLIGAVFWTLNARSESISNTRQHIQRTWTNEGDITSQDVHFIDLSLSESDGDLIGSLTSPSIDRSLDVHADIGWRSTILRIRELRGRNVVDVAEARVSLTGNNNRLEWKVVSANPPSFLPKRAILWPVPTSSGE